MHKDSERIVTADNPLNGYSCYDYEMAIHSDGLLAEQWSKTPKIHIEHLRQAAACLLAEVNKYEGKIDYSIEDLDFYRDPEVHDEWNNKRHRVLFELCGIVNELQIKLQKLTVLYWEVNCFKGAHYQWFKLPIPMIARDARAWAKKELDMPVEAFR